MKVFIALVALTVIIAVKAGSIPDELKEKLANHRKECSAKTGVDKEVLEKAHKGEFSADDPKLKEQIFCVSKKIGFQNDAGEIQQDVLKAKLNVILKDTEATLKLVEKCSITKDTPQNTAFETATCIHKNSKINFCSE